MIAPFLQSLFDHGHVNVSHPDQPLSDDELQETAEVLEEYEVIRRRAFPGTPPAFSVPAATWAAKSFYRGCQAATFRDIPAELLPQFLGDQCSAPELVGGKARAVSGGALAPGGGTAQSEKQVASAIPLTHCPDESSLHYSVDLVFQYLPDLTKLCGFAMAADPLLDHLRMWANQWPLSSVGMPDVTPVTLQGIVEHSSLLQYYVDRIIARRDKTRLANPLIQQVMRTRLSLYHELFPQFADLGFGDLGFKN